MNRRAAALSLHEAAGPAAAAPPSRAAALAALARVLALSEEIERLADAGDVGAAMTLDGERRALLASARAALVPYDDGTLLMLRRICELNDRSIGRLEHRLRALGRDMDLLATGRRAVLAYGEHRR